MLANDLYLSANKPIHEQSPEVFYKKLFLKISQNSQKNTYARVSFLI